MLLYYRKQYRQQSGGISPKLYQKLEENARIEDPEGLWKSGVVFLLVLIGFVLGERIHMALAVTAIAGATFPKTIIVGSGKDSGDAGLFKMWLMSMIDKNKPVAAAIK